MDKKKMTVEEAVSLLQKNMENKNLQRHCLGVGKTLAEFYDYYKSKNIETGSLNRDEREAVGILHDADWEVTKDNPEKHTYETLEWLKDFDVSEEFLNVIKSHNSLITQQRKPETLLEWTLECCDELTGFIVATALVMPNKKLEDVSTESVLKKFKQKEFARAVDRSQIEQCEVKLGIDIKTFVDITLKAMKDNHEILGL